ncbi:MAG TPA: multicopper oxidase domain-containing protein [Candidatus Saccharimonadales bacterium]|nr:multicopper oxidase domain-containing protein [Candidatus Saccharimonadales bacterium]
MAGRILRTFWILAPLFFVAAIPVAAQSFRVQCPTSTVTHPATNPNSPTHDNNSEPPYTAPTTFVNTNPGSPANGYVVPIAHVNGAIKCQQVSGGDGYSTMANGTQTFMFSFGPLSGLADIANGQPGTEFPNVFNTLFPAGSTLLPGDPATTDGITANTWPSAGSSLLPVAESKQPFTFNGAVGLAPDIANLVTIYDIAEDPATSTTPTRVWIQTNAPLGVNTGDMIVLCGTGTYTATPKPPCGAGTAALNGYDGTWPVSSANIDLNSVTLPTTVTNYGFPAPYNFTVTVAAKGLADVNESATATVGIPPQIDGHVDPRQIMDVGVMNGSIPAPLIAFDEDDEMFLTLTNVGMIMRPDLFEQHTIHFHGYPNASSVYDGVPDASVAINIGGSFTYYYLSPDAGTYFWHCHITPPEHLQMGMVGQLYVRPRQNRVPNGVSLYAALQQQNSGVDLRTACNPSADILCSATLPASNSGVTQGTDKLGNPQKYTYNDGDASTAYDVEYPLQIHGFDPNFHFVGMTFNPEMFADMKDKFYLLNGRSYPDTIQPGPMATQSSDGRMHFSQPLPSIINIPAGGKALLRIADLDVSEYQTLASMGLPMKEVGFNAKLLRDQAGNNMEFYTNSITLGGGESLDVILDASDDGCGVTGCAQSLYPPGSTFYLYTPNLDHLSNDQENFGGLMTEVHICNSVTGSNTFGNTCN